MNATQVPVWEQYTLTVEEASKYFRIGENKLRRIVGENRDAEFVLWNGNRAQIKRKLFEKYAEIDALNTEIKVVAEMVDQCVKENAGKKQSQEAYVRKYNTLVKRYDKAAARLNDATAERNSRAARDWELRIFISELTEKPLVLEEWDEELWVSILETATVQRNGHITFLFKDGTSIEVGAE